MEEEGKVEWKKKGKWNGRGREGWGGEREEMGNGREEKRAGTGSVSPAGYPHIVILACLV